VNGGSRVRPAVFAGSFYPADPAALRAELRRAYAAARPAASAGPPPKAIVGPHAGYVYSGPVAATAYAQLRPLQGTVERVVLLGPSHQVAFDGMAVPTADVFATPLGPLQVDLAGRDTVAGLPGVLRWDAPHAREHSLEAHLPFILDALGDVAILPIVVGRAPADQVAAVIDAVWGGVETLIVVSSDLSHYHAYDDAVRLDQATVDAVEAGRPDGVGPSDACGVYPIRGLLVAAGRRGLQGRAVDVRNSGDTAGSRDRVVGYGAFVFA